MTDEQWQRAWDIYQTAASLDGEKREFFLASVKADPEVLDEVVSMIEEARQTTLGPDRLESHKRTGTRVGRYEVAELLSSGGVGEVYEALDPELDRKVAIKFLSPELAASGAAIERLIREAKAASALNHPHIITVYEVIRTGEDVAIAMELVEGSTLRTFCGKRADVAQVTDWGRQTAQALAAAHQRHIVHRDVKPENLMVRKDGILKVLDFGLAGESHEGAARPETSSGISGTLNYMSPEQTRAESATAASDVFSLGVVLYELVTGEHPFRSASPIDTAYAISHTEPKPPSSLNSKISPQLHRLLLRMLAKNPDERPTALEVHRELAASGVRRVTRLLPWLAAAISVLTLSGALIYVSRDELFSNSEPQFLQLTRQIHENRVTTMALSPDGQTLMYATFGGSVYRRRMNDGHTQPVHALKELRVDRMVWFGDGSKVLINGSLAGAQNKYDPGVWVLPAEGSAAEQVLSGARNGVPSPDGSTIAFTSTDGSLLSVASLTDGVRRQIRSGGETNSFSSLVWSPDGKRLAFQRSEYPLPAGPASGPTSLLVQHHYEHRYESVDVASGRLVASVKDFVMESACGLLDGSILFLRDSVKFASIYHLWRLRTDPRTGRFLDEPRPYTHADYDLREISASADGKNVVAIRGVNRHPNIYIADLPPPSEYPRFARVRRLTFTDADEYPHSWTPDSRSVIFESSRNGQFNLFSQDIDESDAHPIVISKTPSVLPHVSPDGKWVLYNQEKGGKWRTLRMPLAGGSSKTIVGDMEVPGEHTCSTQPAGRCVLRTLKDQQFVFWELDPVHGKGRELARTGWSPAVVGDWDISPDGSQVAIPNHDPRDARIRVVPLDARGGTTEKVVTIGTLRSLWGVVWAADGKGWYVSARDPNREFLLYVDLEGRILTNLMESMAPSYAVPSPDGRRVAFMDWTVNANVWQVRGL